VPDRRPSYEELEALVASQATLIAELGAEVTGLRAKVAELEGRLAQNSRNSSRPPSSDGYEKPAPKSLRRPSGRKPGGQSGHPGRRLQRVERPDEVILHVPERCGRCGGDLGEADCVGEEARQVFDLPPVALAVTEHRAQRRRCGCGAVTAAPFPDVAPAPTQYGPRLRALAIYLVASQRLPYLRASRLLSDWLSAPISTGTLRAIVKRGGEDLDGFGDVVHEQLTGSAVAHFDETGARAQGALRWVHSASTERLTLYRVHDRRGLEGIDHLGVLGEFEGVAVHDGWVPYRTYEGATHALCNVHHLRELLGAIERNPETQTWAKEMDGLLREIKSAVDRARDAGATALDARVLKAFRSPLRQQPGRARPADDQAPAEDLGLLADDCRRRGVPRPALLSQHRRQARTRHPRCPHSPGRARPLASPRGCALRVLADLNSHPKSII
jgi:transposase